MYPRKLRRKQLTIDMAAMCDVAFLLLTFFVLCGTRIIRQPININMPSSTYTGCRLDEGNEVTILIDQHKVMLALPDAATRKLTLNAICKSYHISFSSKERSNFGRIDIIGTPVRELKSYLADYDVRDLAQYYTQKGIPFKKGNNDLANWIYEARRACIIVFNSQMRVVIKADENVEYPLIKRVINILQDQGVNKFSLLTSLKFSKQ